MVQACHVQRCACNPEMFLRLFCNILPCQHPCTWCLCGIVHLSDVAPGSFPPQELLRRFISFPGLRPEFRPFRFGNIVISPKRIVGGFSSRPSAFTLAECTNYCTRPDPRYSFPHALALLHAALSYCRHLFMPCPCAAARSYPARCPGMASAPLAPVHGSRGHDSKAVRQYDSMSVF